VSVRLLVRQRNEAGGTQKPIEVVIDEPAITIGRDKACQLVLSQQAVSRTHARITRDGALFFVEDMGSAYGTQVNSQPLPKGEKRLLRDGDIIAIAQFDVTFDRVIDLPPIAQSEKTSMLAKQLVKDAMRGMGGSAEGPYFRIMNGPKEGLRIELGDVQELIIGRDEVADIVLKDDLVSRQHAKVRRDWSGTHLEDLDSRNGMKINRRRVKRKTLRDSDEVEIGSIRLLYLDPNEVKDPPELSEVSAQPAEDDDGGDPTHNEPDGPEPVKDPPAKPAAAALVAAEHAKAAAASPATAKGPPPGQQVEEEEEEEQEEEPEDDGRPDKKMIAALVGMGVFALMLLGLIVAVLAGL
jgi:pSer/pThr/pTyr-binding forkhead associated (FHA) protein